MMMMMMMKNEANIMLSMYEYNIIYGNNMERERGNRATGRYH